MPTYQYRCTHCGEDLEVVQRFSDAPLTECPACGGKLRKIYNAVGVVFKGSGFYKTDSRSESKSAATSSPKATTSEKTSPSSAKESTSASTSSSVSTDS